MSYSLSALVRGNAVQTQADAECKRYRAESDIHAFIAGTLSGRSATALTAKVQVLEAALPRALATLKAFETGVVGARNTVDDLHILQMRTDALRALIHHAHEEIGALAEGVNPPPQSLSTLLRNRDAAEAEVSQKEASVRSAKGWDLNVRGGYEQIVDAPVTTPVFGVATLSVDLGWFFQGNAERSSAAARKVWARRQIEGVDQRAENASQRLNALRTSEGVRLVEMQALLADLDLRQTSLESMTSDRAKAFAQVLWFDRVGVEAESAYLRAHIQELDRVLFTDGGGTR